MEINWNQIPKNPGVYLWKDKDDQIIYVGKAKNLRNRMKQYFNNELSLKNQLLLKHIFSFDYQVCASEMEALILEQNLINEYEPKYNIKIKSSKTYPYIELKKGKNIKLSVSKNQKFYRGAKYYGPFPDGFSARRIIKILSSCLPLDLCLSPNKNEPCLNYQMGRCMGQCVGENTEEKKQFIIEQIENFFKGKTIFFEEELKRKIEKNNKIFNFEESQKLLENLNLIKKIKEQRITKFNDNKHRDIFNFYASDGIVSISMMSIRFGHINITNNYMNKQFNPDPKDSIESFISRYYLNAIIPDEVVVPFELQWEHKNFHHSIPKKGVKKELIDIVYEHAKSKYESNIKSFLFEIKNYEYAMKIFKEKISNKEIHTIEMIDISSTMGSEQVGAIVHFKNGEKRKSKYRKYIVNNVNKMDDYASIEEVSRRHFQNIIDKKEELPDLFIVDGKYQLIKVKKVLEELNIKDVALFGLIKDENHKTNAIIDSEMKIINLEKGSFIHLFLTRIQDEVHRFVIHFHRSRREKIILESELDKYTFLNEIDKQNLFREFKSIRKILIASDSELRKIISNRKVDKFIKSR
ncbi:MAG: UvrABC system protein C [Candidatus Tyloplasma litorale]|nr:MAG: UvrABC system protein C [Mycoplasmatales bacterium]